MSSQILGLALSVVPGLCVVVILWGAYWILTRLFFHEKANHVNPYKLYKTVRKMEPVEVVFMELENEATALAQTSSFLVEGPITPAVLLEAMKYMQAKHPPLRWGIHKTRGVAYFHEYLLPNDHLDFQTIERKDDVHWQRVARRTNDTLRQFVRDNGLLWGLKFLYNTTNPTGPHEIILESSHTIIDGTSFVIFMNDLLNFCGKLIDKEDIKIEPKDNSFSLAQRILYSRPKNLEAAGLKRYLPSPILTLWVLITELTSTHEPLSSNVQANFKNISPKTGLTKRGTKFIAWKLSKEATNQFYLKCKANGVSFTSGMGGLSMWAAQEAFNLPPKRNICYLVPARLREFANPPLPLDNIIGLGVSYTLMDNKTTSRSSTAFWEYAKLFQENIHNNKYTYQQRAADTYFSEGALSPIIRCTMEMISQDSYRSSNIILSNIGELKFCHTSFGNSVKLNGWFDIDKEMFFGEELCHFLVTLDGTCCGTTEWVAPYIEDEAALKYSSYLEKGFKVMTEGHQMDILPSAFTNKHY